MTLFQLLQTSRNLRYFLLVRMSWALGSQMLNVAIGWTIYDITHNPLNLGYVGLAQFLPNLVLSLVAGQMADRFDRRAILAASFFVQALCSALFLTLLLNHASAVWPLYGLLVVFGAGRAFSAPAMSSLLPLLVPRDVFPRAVALGSSSIQLVTIGGPALGGFLYAWNGAGLLACITGMFVVATALIGGFSLNAPWPTAQDRPLRPDRILDGLRYVCSNRLILGAISLDMFAVLFGGVTALLPIFAHDILAIGPQGLGYLRSAPGLGAAIVGLLLARRSISGRAGAIMLGCVAGFGVATVVFALSKSLWLSLTALIALGGFDMVSVVIRQTLIQMATPDDMRGRVSAVNFVFIGASNQLGEFESGVTAALFGTIPSALLGGFGTMFIVALWARLFPELRRADRLSG